MFVWSCHGKTAVVGDLSDRDSVETIPGKYRQSSFHQKIFGGHGTPLLWLMIVYLDRYASGILEKSQRKTVSHSWHVIE